MKHFHVGAVSGTIAATTTGVVFAWRNASADSIQYIQRFRFKLTPIANPTAVAFASLQVKLQSVFNANYTGGTDLLTATRPRILDLQRIVAGSQAPVSANAAGNIRIASTTNLTAGGGDVIDTQPWAHVAGTFPAVATAQQVQPLILEWTNPTLGLEHNDPYQGCLALRTDTGFNVTLPVALAAGFTAELAAEVEWLE